MSRKKSRETELSVFKGREARLNRAVFQILALKSSLTIYDIWKEVRKLRSLKQTKYSTVNRRARTLEEQGYLIKAGFRGTKSGGQAVLYQINIRVNVALCLHPNKP